MARRRTAAMGRALPVVAWFSSLFLSQPQMAGGGSRSSLLAVELVLVTGRSCWCRPPGRERPGSASCSNCHRWTRATLRFPRRFCRRTKIEGQKIDGQTELTLIVFPDTGRPTNFRGRPAGHLRSCRSHVGHVRASNLRPAVSDQLQPLMTPRFY